MPALDAGPPSRAFNTNTPRTPSCGSMRYCCANPVHQCTPHGTVHAQWHHRTCSTLWSGANEMPMTGRTTLPYLMICSTLLRTTSEGMAKPTPLEAPLGE